ncbi:hypothetical protein PACTADRAFT_42034 [Pachysolen tannophilus NRRL Y-2460]|uniref:Sulfhydryl oxidase n=1 Tax=Pachysolen tannophilus NRRL Y-2460 TaxID=669874 RepID=A0A1E4TUC7_PACTA|nr:hypothetical protein PACTADRAFT_42034 [Pachysolen tannophilus NRRL Y-2460]
MFRIFRKWNISIILALVFLLTYIFVFSSKSGQLTDVLTRPITSKNFKNNAKYEPNPEAFMPNMTNETLKAELGNASWKLLHTVLARYPVIPSTDQQSHLSNFITYFAKVYPCGDCARHFQQLLVKYPPQISTRSNAAIWGCHIHNLVNERLNKTIYNCNHIIEDYQCGCGEEEQPDQQLQQQQEVTNLNAESENHLETIKLDSKEETPQLG